LNWIQKINEHALEPDLGVFIDVNPETVMSRLKPKKSVMENIETQKKVREIYLKFVEDGKLIRIDGNKSKNEVSKEIYAVVMKFLNAPY
jgi:thymidylate kinase